MAAEPDAEEGSRGPRVAEASPVGAVFVDPAGLLMFGPLLGGELNLDPASVVVYGRWLNGGLLSREVFPNEQEEFAFSFGIGARARYYISGQLRGLFAGLGIEYLSSRIEDESNLIATNSSFLVPQADFGYRHAIGAFFVGGTAGLGYALELSSEVENLPGGTDAELFEPADVSTVFGSVGIELGVTF